MKLWKRGLVESDIAERNRWWLVGGAGLGVFIAALDTSIVTVALPTIEEELRTATSVTEWVVLGYLLPMIALTLPGGRWLDRVGHRAALTFSVAGFAVTSAAAGLARSIEWLIAARVAQGAFAAILFALIPVLATAFVRPGARGRAMAVVTTLGPLGAVSGPVLGGFLLETWGWPWIFLVNIPVCLAVIAIGLAQLPRGEPLRLPNRSLAAEALLLGGAATALLLALSFTASGSVGWIALVLLTIPLLVAWRRMASSRVVIDLVRSPGMSGPHLSLLAVACANMVLSFLMPFYLHRVVHASPATIGLTVLALPLFMAVLSPVGGLLADHWDARRTAIMGVIAITLGVLLLVPLGQEWTVADVAWRLAIVGIGNGLFNGPNMTVAMSTAPRDRLGITGASTSLVRQLGFALGPALATVVWAISGYALGGMRAAIGLAAGLGALAVFTLVRARGPQLVDPIHGARSSSAEARTVP